MRKAKEAIKDDGAFVQNLADKLRFTARNPTIERYRPHEKQLTFHKSEKPGRQLIGGNRSGKTVGGGAETVFYATGKHPYKSLPWSPPLRLRVVTVDIMQGLEKIVLPEISKWCPPSELINGSWEDSYEKSLRTLYLANNSFIEFMTHEQDLDSFAGTSRHGIWFDEEPPKNIFTECKLRLLDTEGHWWMTMTPVEGMTWTFEEIYEKNDPFIDIIEVDMDDNPHLSEQGKAIALSGLSKEDIEARRHGHYVTLGGLIYKEFNFDKHVVKPHLPPVGSLVISGMDHGFTNPTAWLWAYVDEKARLVVFDEHYKSGEIVQWHARAVREKDAQHGYPPVYSVGDPSIRNTDPITGTSVQIEYLDNGLNIMLGNNDVRAGIDRVKKLINLNRFYVTENCVNLLWELKRYRWATWKGKNDLYEKNKKEEPQKKDDHACDALRYLVASRPEVEDGQWVPLPHNHIGAPEAIEPDKPYYDKGVRQLSNTRFQDEHLGGEF